MGLWYWTEVQEELERYLYFADRGPASKPWFEKAVGEYKDWLWCESQKSVGSQGSEEPKCRSCYVAASPASLQTTMVKAVEPEIDLNAFHNTTQAQSDIMHPAIDPAVLDESWYTYWGQASCG